MGEYVISRGHFGVPLDASRAAGRWWAFLLLGVASVVIGFLLLFDLVAAAGTLALLVAIGLLASGLGELVGSGRYRTTWSMVAGAILVAAGIVAAVWPGITLWALAVVTGAGLLISGALRMSAAWYDRPDGWGWLMVGGVLSVLVGVAALAWPGATVLVLAILLGLRMVVYGGAEIAFALALRDARRAIG